MKKRCGWCLGDPLYEAYHDKEWGVPVKDDPTLFEFLILETFQAGLSWITVLRKRENFRAAFDHFDYQRIAKYDKEKVESLMMDKGIIRNRQKIEAAIRNAQSFLEVQQEFGSFANYIWSYVDHSPVRHAIEDYRKAPAFTPLAEKISKDLKSRGFSFVGPTVVYAHMQATGMVNDHETSCFRYDEV